MALEFLASVLCSSVSFYVNVTHRYCLLAFCGEQIAVSFSLISPGGRCVKLKTVSKNSADPQTLLRTLT
jgi:hypothetical protein